MDTIEDKEIYSELQKLDMKTQDIKAANFRHEQLKQLIEILRKLQLYHLFDYTKKQTRKSPARRSPKHRLSGQTREKAIIQDYVNRMNSQFIIDPTTKQPKRMLDNPTIGLVIKLATFSYMTRILFISSFKRDNRSFDSSPLTKTKTWQLSPLSIIFRRISRFTSVIPLIGHG